MNPGDSPPSDCRYRLGYPFGRAYRAALSAACLALAAGLAGLPPAPAARAEAPASQPVPVNAAELSERLAELSRSLEPYRVDGDVRTHLFFRYADAPYTRATIACLLAAEQTLGLARSSSAPSLTHSPESVSLASGLLRWCDGALARVRTGSPLDDSYGTAVGRPAKGQAVVRFGWVAAGSSGDPECAARVDLAACLGAGLFVDARSGVANDSVEALADRARFLGVAYGRSGRMLADSSGSVVTGDRPVMLPPGGYDVDAVEQWRAALWMEALGGRRVMLFSLDDAGSRPWMMEATAHCGLDFSRLAGVLNRFPGPTDVAVLGASADGGPPTRVAGPWASGSWSSDTTGAKVRDGSSAALLAEVHRALEDAQVPVDVLTSDTFGDRDAVGRYRVLILAGMDRVSPALRERIRRFRDAGGVLLAVGKCLTDMPRSGPGSIGFDLEIGDKQLPRLCDYLLRLRDRGTILADQVVPVSADGALVQGLWSGTARPEKARGFIYVVNRTNGPLSILLRYRGRVVAGRAEELVNGRSLELTQTPLALPPHAIWVLQVPIPPR